MRATISVIAGVAGTILTFGIVYVRGDGAGIMSFLRSRAEFRRLKAEETNPELIQNAQEALQAQAAALAHPQLALQLWPLELLIGLIIGLVVFWAFRRNYQQLSTKARPDIQERMAIRLVQRIGRPFTLSELSSFKRYSPLSTAQLHAALERLIDKQILIPQIDQSPDKQKSDKTCLSKTHQSQEFCYWFNFTVSTTNCRNNGQSLQSDSNCTQNKRSKDSDSDSEQNHNYVSTTSGKPTTKSRKKPTESPARRSF